MTNHFQVSRTLVRRLEELGIPLVSVLRQANLPPGLFEQSKIWMTTEEMFSLYVLVQPVLFASSLLFDCDTVKRGQ